MTSQTKPWEGTTILAWFAFTIAAGALILAVETMIFYGPAIRHLKTQVACLQHHPKACR